MLEGYGVPGDDPADAGWGHWGAGAARLVAVAMPELVAQPAAGAVPELAAQPAADAMPESVTQPVADAMPESAAQPVADAMPESVTQPVAVPVRESVDQPPSSRDGIGPRETPHPSALGPVGRGCFASWPAST